MQLKKFICPYCGAPKTSKFDGIFVVCDYCDHFFDIDFHRHLHVWSQDNYRVDKWNAFMQNFRFATSQALSLRDKKTYRRWQYDRLTTYARLYLYALPPQLPMGEARNLYVRGYADFRTDIAFSDLTQSEKYLKYRSSGNHVANFDDLVAHVTAYYDYLNMEAEFIYSNTKYTSFTKYWPQHIYIRHKIFDHLKNWIDRVEPAFMKELLSKYDLQEEFIELNDEDMEPKSCEGCGEKISLPAGTIRHTCKKCKHQNLFHSSIQCFSCGQENRITSEWIRTIICSNCNTLLKLVKPAAK